MAIAWPTYLHKWLTNCSLRSDTMSRYFLPGRRHLCLILSRKQQIMLANVYHHIDRHRNEQSYLPKGLPEPTTAEPGSKDKIAVLASRVEAGLELHHRLAAYRWPTFAAMPGSVASAAA